MTSKTIKLDLGVQHASLKRRIASGQYEDASDVVRTALRALDREDIALDIFLSEKVKASLADKRPSVPATDVFRRLRTRHARRVKAAARDD